MSYISSNGQVMYDLNDTDDREELESEFCNQRAVCRCRIGSPDSCKVCENDNDD